MHEQLIFDFLIFDFFIIDFSKDELGGKILIEFVLLRPKTYSYLMDDDSGHQKVKWTKKSVIKRRLKFNDYKDCLFNNKTILQLQQRFKGESLCLYTEEIDKIALSRNDDKRIQTFDKIATYPYGNIFLNYVKMRC